MSEHDLPHFIERLTGHPIKSKTDEGAVLELMDAFGLAPPPHGQERDYDAETESMRARRGAAASHGEQQRDG